MNFRVTVFNKSGESYSAIVLAKGRNQSWIIPCEYNLAFPCTLMIPNDMIVWGA